MLFLQVKKGEKIKERKSETRRVSGRREKMETVRFSTEPFLMRNQSSCFVQGRSSYFKKKLTTSCMGVPALVNMNSTAAPEDISSMW